MAIHSDQIKSTGKWGEDQAEKYLRKKGYRTVERNFSCRFGEIDLIVSDQAYLVFVEVKTRKMNAMVSPVEAVDLRKQQKLVLTAQVYMQQHPCSKQPRFDVFEVLTGTDGKPTHQRHLPNAFDASCIDGLYY